MSCRHKSRSPHPFMGGSMSQCVPFSNPGYAVSRGTRDDAEEEAIRNECGVET